MPVRQCVAPQPGRMGRDARPGAALKRGSARGGRMPPLQSAYANSFTSGVPFTNSRGWPRSFITIWPGSIPSA
jgi:hypothetical protein